MRPEAGTDVVVDLLFFQAPGAGGRPSGPDFLNVGEALPETKDGDAALFVNRYFLDHPHMVLGRHDRTTSPYGVVYTCSGAIGPALQEALDARITDLPRQIHQPGLPCQTPTPRGPTSLRRGSAPSRTVPPSARAHPSSCRNRLHQVVNGLPSRGRDQARRKGRNPSPACPGHRLPDPRSATRFGTSCAPRKRISPIARRRSGCGAL